MATASRARILDLIEPGIAARETGLLHRLRELGFLPGEVVSVLRRGSGGVNPSQCKLEKLFSHFEVLRPSVLQWAVSS